MASAIAVGASGSTSSAAPAAVSGSDVVSEQIAGQPEAISAGLLEAIARADELRDLGRARAALYTWERSAELLVSAWQSLT